MKKEAAKILKYKDVTIAAVLMECKNKRDISNSRGSWNHLRLIKEIHEQHIGKARI
jgi:hypothetical protein